MTWRAGRFLRDNTLLLAAVALPLIVVVFFMLATAIPRWTVPPPAYDLVFRVDGIYDRTGSRVQVAYNERDGRVEATVRPLAENMYLPSPVLFLFDHQTLNVREIRVDLPDLEPRDPPRTLVVEELAGRRVDPQSIAPDGYALSDRGRRAPGLIGDLFGMGRYESNVSLVNGGRVVRLALPSQYQYVTGVSAIGWIVDDARR
jgi:hypothetical protein